MKTVSTSDERITAALVHGSIFLAFLGPIAPVLIWASQRRKSKYVSFHALQAMSFQTMIFWLWIIGMPVVMVLAIFLFILLSVFTINDSGSSTFNPLIFQFLIFLLIFSIMGIVLLTSIFGAVSCLLGRDFRYPLIGKWLERYLYQGDISGFLGDEVQEDKLVAGICHAMAILQFWGMITPLIIWFTQKERSVLLRFQAMQAAIYQGVSAAAYILGMMLYMFSFFGMFFVLFAFGLMNGSSDVEGPGAVIMLVFFGILMIFWFAFMILMPVYYLLAWLGSIRVIKGHHFRYPILGKLLEKRMEKQQNLEPAS